MSEKKYPYQYEGRWGQQERLRRLAKIYKPGRPYDKAPVFEAPRPGDFLVAPTGARALGRHPRESVFSYVRRLEAAGEHDRARAITRRHFVEAR